MWLYRLTILVLLCTASQQRPENTNAPVKTSMSTSSRFGMKYDEALEAIFAVAIRLEALLTDTQMKTTKNFIVSPLSMAVAVGELLLGTSGPLHDELNQLLTLDAKTRSFSPLRHQDSLRSSVDGYALHEQLGNLMQSLQTTSQAYTLKTASILFVQENLRLHKPFVNNINKFYGTQVQELDFTNRPADCTRIVNNWAKMQTNGLITDIGGAISSYTRAILANAVYFRGNWEIPFSNELNRRGTFRVSPEQNVSVTYMLGEFENYRYSVNKRLNCRMVEVPYENKEVMLYIVLPDENSVDSINSFTKTLKIADINEMIDGLKPRKVLMVLPKMSLSSTLKMLEPLKKYHRIKQMQLLDGDLETRIHNFDPNQVSTENVTLEYSAMFEDTTNELSNIVQQMTLSFNEKGTEAAAISAGIIDYILDSVTFKVDRPFLFFIKHQETGADLFWGTVVDPTEYA